MHELVTGLGTDLGPVTRSQAIANYGIVPQCPGAFVVVSKVTSSLRLDDLLPKLPLEKTPYFSHFSGIVFFGNLLHSSP